MKSHLKIADSINDTPRHHFWRMPPIYAIAIYDRDVKDIKTTSPKAWLLVERKESITELNGEILAAKISFSYTLVFFDGSRHSIGGRWFNGEYDKMLSGVERVSITGSLGSQAVDFSYHELKGFRITTYFLSELAHWARQWPDANVSTFSLIDSDGKGANGIRRNRLYENCGFKFHYTNVEKTAGYSLPMKSVELICHKSWESNITEYLLRDAMIKIAESEHRLRGEVEQLEKRIDCYKDREEKARASPCMWALTQYYSRFKDYGIVGLIFLGFILIIYKVVKHGG